MPDPRPHVLIAGVSTRALAVSAARGGYRVTAVDAFGDADLRAVAEVIALRRESGATYGPEAAAAAARMVSAESVAYTSNFENHPRAVATLAEGRRLLGNPVSVLERVRHPLVLMRTLRDCGFAVPVTRASAPAVDGKVHRWLLKPRRSGGGHGTVPWRRGRPVSRHAYLQERITGAAGSIVFAADGRRAVPLGLTRQLVGERAFGARGFRYCGSLLVSAGAPLFERQEAVLERAIQLAEAATRAFGLRGLNGLDFIARGGVPLPIEVNPRYSASMELVERAAGISLFRVHADACAGRLSEVPPPGARVHGKAVVYARTDIVVDDPSRWTGVDMADVPHPGERIARDRPVCTLLADAADGERCVRTLAAAAVSVYRAAERGARGAA